MHRQRPRLRNGVDLLLQSAFQEGNWSVVVRLAEKRARSLKDQYYDIMKICAEAQLDDPNAKFAAATAVWQYVQDGTVVKDVDGIDLLEWATTELVSEDEFSQSFGPLRVRCAKASSKDKVATTRCLESCLLHWDLVSAQQIAAIIDKSFPQERSFMFWNITITYILAQSPQSPPEKKKLYGMLAQRQIERAAQLTEQAEAAGSTEPTKLPGRGIQTEEEILLLYEIVETVGSAEEFEKLTNSPVFSPIVQFRHGRKELFRRVVAKHRRDGKWEEVFKLCRDCLSHTDEVGKLTLLAADWAVWQHLIDAAGHLKNVDLEITKTVQDVLLELIKASYSTPLYRRNAQIARVAAAFVLLSGDQEDLLDNQPSSLRLKELINYITHQTQSASCFDDIKRFVEQLDASAMKYIAYEYKSRIPDDTLDSVKKARRDLLFLKLQYLVLTNPSLSTSIAGEKTSFKCTVCETEGSSTCSCSHCLSELCQTSLKIYNSFVSSTDNILREELLPETAMIIAFCNIQLAFPGIRSAHSSVSSTSLGYLLPALLLLEHQLTLTPKHSQISLILVRLHILVGSAPRAREIWETLDVKRTIVDSLAPIFYDRLSTMAPGVLSPHEDRGWELVEMVRSHYSASLSTRMPKRLIDAFEAGSYNSVVQIPKYIESLRSSCTRAMSLVEGYRTERLLDQSYGELLNDPRFTEVTDELNLNEVVDYGSFPAWESQAATPVYELLRVGPAPSNRRSHLSLLAEAFHELLFFKPPTVYKVSTNATGTDQTFVIEMMSQFSNSFSKFLGGAEKQLTTSETVYFSTLSLLSTLIVLCTGSGESTPPPEVFSHLTDAVNAGLDTIRAEISTDEQVEFVQTIETLSSMHSITMLHDTAIATRLSSQWLLSFNEREKERDRSGKSNLPKEVVSQIKSIQSTAEQAIREGKERIGKLQTVAAPGGDLTAQAKKWISEKDANGLGTVVDTDGVPELTKSWRLTISGWQDVKWE